MRSFNPSLAPAVNSCSVNKGGCEQDCVQLGEDRYKCQCRPGYQLKRDARSCEGESGAACLETRVKGNLKDPQDGASGRCIHSRVTLLAKSSFRGWLINRIKMPRG